MNTEIDVIDTFSIVSPTPYWDPNWYEHDPNAHRPKRNTGPDLAVSKALVCALPTHKDHRKVL